MGRRCDRMAAEPMKRSTNNLKPARKRARSEDSPGVGSRPLALVPSRGDLRPLLTQQPLARDLDPKQIEKLASCAALLDLQPGDYLWRQGEKPEVVFLVSEGQVALEIQVPGQGGLEVDLIREGEFLPWLWLGGEYRRRFDARVVLPAKVIALDGKQLRHLCEADHEFGYHLLKRFAHATEDRLQTARVRLMELQSHPTPKTRGSR